MALGNHSPGRAASFYDRHMGIDISDLYIRLRLMGDIDSIVADSADLISRYRLDLDTVRDVLAQEMSGAG